MKKNVALIEGLVFFFVIPVIGALLFSHAIAIGIMVAAILVYVARHA
jgi:hypothetical protein